MGLAIGTKSEQGSRTGRCGWITSFLGSPFFGDKQRGLLGCVGCFLVPACVYCPIVGGGCGCAFIGLGIKVLERTSTLSGSRSTPCERPPPVGGGCLRSQLAVVVLLVWVVCGGLFVICIVVASIFVLYCFLCFV